MTEPEPEISMEDLQALADKVFVKIKSGTVSRDKLEALFTEMEEPMSVDDFDEFLNQPAEDDPADEADAWVRFSICPNCRAEYPDFHSPSGSIHTLCDNCGWSSEEDG